MARSLLRTLSTALPLLGLLIVACAEVSQDQPAQPIGDSVNVEDSTSDNSRYEQNFVFASVVGDSIFLVPWLTRTTAYTDETVRETRGWLARSGTWDAFYAEEWKTPLTQTPTQMLPYGNMRLLMQEGDIVDGIIFDDSVRRLELALGDITASWSGPRGEVIDLVEGAAYILDERIEGLILYLARASIGAAPPGGDWGLLISGDSLQLVFAADLEHGGEAEPLFRAWANIGQEERLWPEVRVDWAEVRAFPPARRDVPVSWFIRSPDGSIEGQLEMVSAEIQPGSGPGPLLPVRALSEVAGDIYTEEGLFPVRGLLVHERR